MYHPQFERRNEAHEPGSMPPVRPCGRATEALGRSAPPPSLKHAMNADAMLPYSEALIAYANGDESAALTVRRDDGFETPLPAAVFFRSEDQLDPIERLALEHCRGRVLDVGAGTGIHTLLLQARGLSVTAIDVSSELVELMQARGVIDARHADVFDFAGGPFDTMLFLGHGIGMVENLSGLSRLLSHAHDSVSSGGKMLIHSLDVTVTNDPVHRDYHRAQQRAGRYAGAVRMQFQFRNLVGPYCGWLQVDPATLSRAATEAGWTCRVLRQDETGDYLAQLTVAGDAR